MTQVGERPASIRTNDLDWVKAWWIQEVKDHLPAVSPEADGSSI